MMLACPRCQSHSFTFSFAYGDYEVQIVAGQVLDSVPSASQSSDHPSDTFGFLLCNTCNLTLANQAGEGRLRKADLFNNFQDFLADSPYQGERVQTLNAAMDLLANHLCDRAFAALPETEHYLTGIDLPEAVHQGLNAAIGRSVVGRYKTSAETVLEGLSAEEVTKAKVFLRLNGAAYEETITTRWAPQD